MSRVTPVLLYSLTGAVVLSSLSSCKEKKSEEVKKTMNVVYIMCDDHSYQTISAYDQRYMQCYFENNSIKINCSTSVGKITDEIKADIAGPVIEIGFKCKYLLDPLKVIKEDKVKLQMSGSLLPMKIVPCEGDAYTYLVLPVRLAKE